jgi:hypothetical protein
VSLATEISKRSLTAFCSFCLLPMYRSLSAPKRGQAKIESVRVRRCNRGRVGRRCAERSWGARFGMPACRAHRLTAYQTTFRGHARFLSPSRFRNSSEYSSLADPRSESHASSSWLDHDGTGTVRRRLPLPIKSTMTQRPSRICSCSSVNPTTSERRNPQP